MDEGCRSALRCGTAWFSAVRSMFGTIATSRQIAKVPHLRAEVSMPATVAGGADRPRTVR
ncbi:hypothetical protein [Actinomadura madurae]|uniref:hypothetical protein n=1 Tax=Actinomadura madurae TaxID=1993 RepID=UPI0003F6ADF1